MSPAAQKMKFSIKAVFSKCDQIRSLLRIRSHLLKKYLMENFIFCAVVFDVSPASNKNTCVNTFTHFIPNFLVFFRKEEIFNLSQLENIYVTE